MSEIEQILMAFKKQKLSFTDNNIFDGIVDRYNKSKSFTPKQALWFLKKLTKAGIEIPEEYSACIETPSLPEQKSAYIECINMLKTLTPEYHDEMQQAERFDNMFAPKETSESNDKADEVRRLRIKAALRQLNESVDKLSQLIDG